MRLENKIKEIEKKLEHAKHKERSRNTFVRNIGRSGVFGAIADIAAGIFVGILLGNALDSFLDMSPLFFSLCTVLGAFGDLYNLYRNSIKSDKPIRRIMSHN